MKGEAKKRDDNKTVVLSIEITKDQTVLCKPKPFGPDGNGQFQKYYYDAKKHGVFSQAGDFIVDKLTDEEMEVTFDLTRVKATYTREKAK